MKSIFILFLCLSFFAVSYGQETLSETYVDHFKHPREIVYAHLNKTTFAKGELVGFKAYVFDKGSKEASKKTRNLYCVISDLNGKNIKEALLLVENGVASSAIRLDSVFTPGRYVFKAYTNWMRNFDEPNYFATPIQVIDPSGSNETKDKVSSVVKPDIQVLPEGGHLLANTINTLGVVAKDQFGKGLKYAEAYLVNQSNDTLNRFTLDRFGLGKTLIKPSLNQDYRILVKQGYTYYEETVGSPKPIGVTMALTNTDSELYITMSTNNESLGLVKDQNFTLAIHNGNAITSQDFKFNDNLRLSIRFNKAQLYSGINIITIFNEKNKPILERIFFNYHDIKDYKLQHVRSIVEEDSVRLRLDVKDLDPRKFSSVSVSVLPATTKANTITDNVLSKIHLKPYIKGIVENAAYYFTDINTKKEFELDNLLLTQGWSSYSWNDIFGTQKILKYNFEEGIAFKANINNRRSKKFLVSPLTKSKSFLVDLPEKEMSFEGKRLFPINDEKLVITGINEKGKVLKPGIYTTFFPNKIPELSLSQNFETLNNEILLYNSDDAVFSVDKDITELDEVQILVNKEKKRKEKIERNATGKIHFFDKASRERYVDFASWLSTQGGYIVLQDITQRPMIQIRSTRRNTFGGTTPLIVFDGVPLRGDSVNILYMFSMNNIDYIEVDRNGFSAPFGGQNLAGVIRIKTRTDFDAFDSTFDDMYRQSFDLTFSSSKRYYVPKYQDYNGDFFKTYGVMNWIPNATITEHGRIELAFMDTRTSAVNVYIEGIINDTGFISEIRTIEID